MDDVRRYYATTFGAFPDIAFELIAAHHSDTSLFVEMWMSGSHLGSRHDFEATGKHFRCRMAGVFQFQRRRPDRRADLLRHRHHRPPARLDRRS